jgi:lipopolysaccharide transport system ATP-binding protein
MSDTAILVENLSKRYLVGHQTARRNQHVTLRDVVAREARNYARKTVDLIRGRHIVQGDELEEFWALKNVGFEVKKGEIVGIIGRNGAGKSTLLKVLSRITEPTEGRVSLRGRVASLLEVGTGFHQELTGRENIFLNGAILGMTQREIRRKFDEIVAFAEVDKFLDTPVKHYSSGMYVRLAFAVAAHLEPEILVVDEVLAVGDVEFQQKCLGKMQDVATAGRTILFVSHNIEMIDRLTTRCIFLSNGKLNQDGPTATIVAEYLRRAHAHDSNLSSYRTATVPNSIEFQEVWTETASGERQSTLREGEPMRILLRVKASKDIPCDLAVVIENSREQSLFTTCLTDLGQPISSKGTHVLCIELGRPCLRSGNYLISLAAFARDGRTQFDVVLHVPAFAISGVMDRSFPTDQRWGDVYLPLSWKLLASDPSLNCLERPS